MLSCSAVMTLGFFLVASLPHSSPGPVASSSWELHIQPSPCDLAVYLQIWVCNG